MLTLGLYGLLAVVLAGVLFLAAAYLLPGGEQIAPPIRDEPIWELPVESRLEYGDVATVRLPVALRGYRFAETDLLLDRLADELRERDEEIARLKQGNAAYGPYEPAGGYDAYDTSDPSAGPGASEESGASERPGVATADDAAEPSAEADETWLSERHELRPDIAHRTSDDRPDDDRAG